MHRAGIVFLVMNVLLAFAFFAAVSPVMKKRQATQSALVALEKSRQELVEQVAEIDVQRQALLASANVVEAAHQRALSNHRIVKEELETRVSLSVDRLNDARSRGANLKGSIARADDEVNARDAELLAITNELQQLNVFGGKLDEENAGLAAKLADAKKETDRLAKEAEAGRARLGQLAERFAEPAAQGVSSR